MTTPPPEAAALRLALARGTAWALLIAGWLALGDLGRTHWPLWMAGLGAQVLWLAATGAALVGLRGRRRAASALRWQLGLWGLLCALALAVLTLNGQRLALAVLAVAWAGLLVTASHAVRVQRAAQAPWRPAPPYGPALVGAALAWALTQHPLALAAALAGGPLLLAALLPAQGAAGGCRAGLFDCALPLADAAPWRHPAAWPLWAARAAMLPMMAALSGMASWCGVLGWPAPLMTALHLLAMLLPPWLLRHRPPGRFAAAAVALALGAGLAVLTLRPDLAGLMVASLCHAVAWGLAWRQTLAQRRLPEATPAFTSASGVMWRPALAVALLGAALAAAGPSALMFVHAGLGAIALAGVVLGTWRWAKPQPDTA